jgi:predicted transposase YdaD
MGFFSKWEAHKHTQTSKEMKEARKEGRMEGREEGRKEGRKEGRTNKQGTHLCFYTEYSLVKKL